MKHCIAAVLKQKMSQNAPNPISISIFSGVTPSDRRHWGLCPRPPGREGGKGRERQGEGKERGRRGEGGGREGMGKFASLPASYCDQLAVRYVHCLPR